MPIPNSNHNSNQSRTFRPRWVVLVVLLLLTAIPLAGAPIAQSQDDDEVDLEAARAELDDLRRQELEAAINLELIDADDNQILAALDAVNELVELEEARVSKARQALEAAEAQQAETERALLWATDDIQWYRRQAVDYAVQSYMGLSGRRGSAWLDAEDLTVSAHKVALLDLVSTDNADALDTLKLVEVRFAELVSASEDATAMAEETAADLEAALAALQDKYAVQLEVKAEFDKRRAEWESVQSELQAESLELENFIVAEEERLRQEALAAQVTAGGAPAGVITASGWTWPTSGRIGSGFGQRLHPILGYYRQHDGLDIGGAQGQEIWAASGGVVISAGWRGGFGNAVIIQHADGITTVYAHMSSIGVTVNQSVETGEVIGAVGSTGLSTGPHLHFEVRVNGTAVDPRPYLP